MSSVAVVNGALKVKIGGFAVVNSLFIESALNCGGLCLVLV